MQQGIAATRLLWDRASSARKRASGGYARAAVLRAAAVQYRVEVQNRLNADCGRGSSRRGDRPHAQAPAWAEADGQDVVAGV
jgi:hypothetical protein